MATSARRRRKKVSHGDSHPDERWLVSFADLMTLLVALFMVLFSISSVNKSKFESLQRSLQESFSGRILPGGSSIKESGGSASVPESLPSPPYPSLQPVQGGKPDSKEGAAGAAKAAQREQQDFESVKRKVDALVAQKKLTGKITTKITKDGLLVQLLTDELLFASGSAAVNPKSEDLLAKLGAILAGERRHMVTVEGHTDPVPIHSRQYPTNWELSTTRATSVARDFINAGVNGGRLTAAGRAYLEPTVSNDTASGRALNRRVEVLLPRLAPNQPSPITNP